MEETDGPAWKPSASIWSHCPKPGRESRISTNRGINGERESASEA